MLLHLMDDTVDGHCHVNEK